MIHMGVNFLVAVYPFTLVGNVSVRDTTAILTRVPVFIADRLSSQETRLSGGDSARSPAYEMTVIGGTRYLKNFNSRVVLEVTHERSDEGSMWVELESPMYFRIDKVELPSGGSLSRSGKFSLVKLD